ncbi:MAG: 30S ribosomal protein S8 [Candidatus Diapherotrites archaeon CG08_land_8_20_14_0_20_34_12]|nr:MAG: 30S ribosomal protein S8 [Candidatus Diapherotrites archaeon CG08_land_8_20_14_0_20_34_12]
MSKIDPLADSLIAIKNAEMAVKKECYCKPASKLLGRILEVMKSNGYIEEYGTIEDGREGIYHIKLAGKVNECRAIKPRFAVKNSEIEKYEKRYLPSKGVGIMIVSTPQGVFTHKEVLKKHLGGRLLAYVY